MPERVTLTGRDLDATAVWRIAVEGAAVTIDPDALGRVAANREALDGAIERGERIYGVTTGLGALVRERVSAEDAATMQRDVLRSHAAGVGEPLPGDVVRAALAIRLNGLLRGHSGVRPLVVEGIERLLNAGIVPVVPRTGSLGASGDLAPSAHAFLVLIGEGEAVGPDGRRHSGADVLRDAQLETLELAP